MLLQKMGGEGIKKRLYVMKTLLAYFVLLIVSV